MNSEPHQNAFDTKLSAIITLILGLLSIAGGFWVSHTIEYERATLTETSGTVVSSVSRRERSNDQDKETYAPVIEFLVNGDPTRFTGHYESYRLSNGYVVTVRYDPKHPSTTARVVEPLESWVPDWMFGIGGLCVTTGLGGLFSVFWSSAKQREAEDREKAEE